MERLTIDVSPEGIVTIQDIKGVKGKACKNLTEAYEKSCGKKLEEKFTTEYYEQPNVATAKQG